MAHNKVAKQTSFENLYFIIIKITLFNVKTKFYLRALKLGLKWMKTTFDGMSFVVKR